MMKQRQPNYRETRQNGQDFDGKTTTTKSSNIGIITLQIMAINVNIFKRQD